MTNDRKRALNLTFILTRVRANEQKFRKNQIAYSQGDRADGLFVVATGAVKVAVVSPEGEEAVVAILSQDDLVGQECLAGFEARSATVSTLSDASLFWIAKADLARAMLEHRDFSELLMLHLLEQNIRMQAGLVDLQAKSVEKRLARLLLRLANYGRGLGPNSISSDITQDILAKMIGSSRSNVNAFLRRFRRSGFIEYDGTITVNETLMEWVAQSEVSLEGEGSPEPAGDTAQL